MDPIRLPVERPGGFRGALAHTAFRNIWFSQLAAQLADKFLLFSLIILAYHISGGSTSVAVTLLAYTVPAVLFAPPAGVIADRLNRKQIMLWCNFSRAAIVALIPIAAIVPGLRDDFLHLILITLVFSAVGQLFGPAEAAVIPTILPRHALITANSMALLTMVLTLVVGGVLAPVVSRIDLYAPYWCAVVLLVLAGTLIFASDIPRLERHTESPVEESRSRFRQVLFDLNEGIDALRASRGLRLAFGQVSIAVLVLFNLYTLAPAYVSKVIGIAAQDTYVILGPATAGAILSAVLLGQFLRELDKSRVLAGSLVANGVTLLALAAVPQAMTQFPDLQVHNRITGATFSFLLGVEFGAILIPAITYLMESTSDAIRGRIFALLYMVINGVSAIPVLVAAALADTIGTAQVLGGLGVVLLVGGLGVIAGGLHVHEPRKEPSRSRPG
ncbi:MAG: MFS transporter [Chloroflexi bacterium]|nr:MAG: MFS transporter [Chloroflexota bacterium]TMF78409.1 MAG: MFS transporter [Chloroflexota bacterium]TMF78865.1 MAG: MFS transporter [Chloroflexota bacterium]TMF92392.1 MAG: MFS transporter [Chloroflexota bacterium]TMG44829.1 MAG: MFS transporter [Chloroflexota bacterium]